MWKGQAVELTRKAGNGVQCQALFQLPRFYGASNTLVSQVNGCTRTHHRLLHRRDGVTSQEFGGQSRTNSNCVSGRVPERDVPSRINPSATPEVPVPFTEVTSSVTHTKVLVKTSLAKITSASGLEKTARVMFDEGPEKTWNRKGLADELLLNGSKETVVMTTFGQSVGWPVTIHEVEFSLADRDGNNWVNVKVLAADNVGAPVNAM